MGIQVVNSSNFAEHLSVQKADGTLDEITIHPGRQTLPNGWSLVNDYIHRPHIRVYDPEADARLRAQGDKE